jgi:hypothetical protein
MHTGSHDRNSAVDNWNLETEMAGRNNGLTIAVYAVKRHSGPRTDVCRNTDAVSHIRLAGGKKILQGRKIGTYEIFLITIIY